MKKKILLVLFTVLVLIQFVPALPQDEVAVPEKDFLVSNRASLEITAIITSACYDCHSASVKKPWYSRIAPVSFWIGDHVAEGREHLNFSQWADYSEAKKDHKLEEIIEELEEGEMPLDSYTWLHSEAQLSKSQKELLVQYIQSLRQ